MIASFAVVAADRRLLAVVVAGVGVALLIGALVSRRQTPLAGLALGAALIALRGMTLPVTPALAGTPTDGPWTMIVESIGSPRDGKQVATLRTVEDGATGFRLAADAAALPGDRTG